MPPSAWLIARATSENRSPSRARPGEAAHVLAWVRSHDDEFVLPRVLKNDLRQEDEALESILDEHSWYVNPEGPRFVEIHRNAARTYGHWLFYNGAVSVFHRVLDSDELWLIHRGRLIVHLLADDGSHQEVPLGPDGSQGEMAVLSVPAGTWHAAELAPGELFAFGSNVCAPPFNFEHSFELAQAETLAALHPDNESLIRRLT